MELYSDRQLSNETGKLAFSFHFSSSQRVKHEYFASYHKTDFSPVGVLENMGEITELDLN